MKVFRCSSGHEHESEVDEAVRDAPYPVIGQRAPERDETQQVQPEGVVLVGATVEQIGHAQHRCAEQQRDQLLLLDGDEAVRPDEQGGQIERQKPQREGQGERG